jgi:hypothetical protein
MKGAKYVTLSHARLRHGGGGGGGVRASGGGGDGGVRAARVWWLRFFSLCECALLQLFELQKLAAA